MESHGSSTARGEHGKKCYEMRQRHVGLALALALVVASPLAGRGLPDNKKLGTIFNNDINNILLGVSTRNAVEEYRRVLQVLLAAKPGVLAQNVGMPDPVIYPSRVATTWDKYHNQAIADRRGKEAAEKDTQAATMKALLDAGTDPFRLTIEACRERGVLIVASYRMNAEDFYDQTTDMSDFGRAHKHLQIPEAHCLDPAHPEVYKHRIEIFAEVAKKYDIDGIEFDFRRWTHMISNPRKNHTVLTRMVAETRKMLREVAKHKGRRRLLLGVRVGPMLAGSFQEADFPGASSTLSNPSCEDLGLDVKTWIEKGYVDYVAPSLFWPRWPGLPKTAEFAELAQGRDVGIYPTLFPMPPELKEEAKKLGGIGVDDGERLLRYKDRFCAAALQLYADGADGVSTFNWYFHLHLAEVPNQWQAYYGYGMGGSAVQAHLLSILGEPETIRAYRKQPWAIAPDRNSR